MTRINFIKKSISALILAFIVSPSKVASAPLPDPEHIILHGDGIHDDTLALTAWGQGMTVYTLDGKKVPPFVLQDKKLLAYRYNTPWLKFVRRLSGVYFPDEEHNWLVYIDLNKMRAKAGVSQNEYVSIIDNKFSVKTGTLSQMIQYAKALKHVGLIK